MPNTGGTDSPTPQGGRAREMTSRALRMANGKEVRYVLVGGWNTLFGWAVFVALQLTVGATIGYMAVLVIAQVVSIINAYLCYRWLVFRVQGSWWLDFFRFSTVYWIVFALNIVALPLMVSALGMNVILAQTVFVVVTVIASYIAHNRFSFRRSDPPAP